MITYDKKILYKVLKINQILPLFVENFIRFAHFSNQLMRKNMKRTYLFLICLFFVTNLVTGQAPSLPINFDDMGTTYDLGPFGSNISVSLTTDPTDPLNNVLTATKLPGADCWAGVTIGGPAPQYALGTAIPFSAK